MGDRRMHPCMDLIAMLGDLNGAIVGLGPVDVLDVVEILSFDKGLDVLV